MTIRKLVGQNIRSFRLAKEWSQEELAYKSKLSHHYLGNVERGAQNISLDSLERIAKALGVEIHVLLMKRE
jgi:transcriptional regulator with XRE-family HTH domain